MTIQHPIDKQIDERIRKRRLIYGFSQRDLRKKLGISFQHIQGYETGEVRLIVDTLYNLAEALSVDMSYFVSKPLKTYVIRPFTAMCAAKKYQRVYRKIKDETLRDIVHSVIMALANK